VDAERVEAERLEHGVPLQAHEAAVHVGAREGEQVPHVQPLGRRVGEHHELVERALAAGEVGRVGAALLPALLPLLLDGRRVVAVDVGGPPGAPAAGEDGTVMRSSREGNPAM
jgi:hypothetical protein